MLKFLPRFFQKACGGFGDNAPENLKIDFREFLLIFFQEKKRGYVRRSRCRGAALSSGYAPYYELYACKLFTSEWRLLRMAEIAALTISGVVYIGMDLRIAARRILQPIP